MINRYAINNKGLPCLDPNGEYVRYDEISEKLNNAERWKEESVWEKAPLTAKEAYVRYNEGGIVNFHKRTLPKLKDIRYEYIQNNIKELAREIREWTNTGILKNGAKLRELEDLIQKEGLCIGSYAARQIAITMVKDEALRRM